MDTKTKINAVSAWIAAHECGPKKTKALQRFAAMPCDETKDAYRDVFIKTAVAESKVKALPRNVQRFASEAVACGFRCYAEVLRLLPHADMRLRWNAVDCVQSRVGKRDTTHYVVLSPTGVVGLASNPDVLAKAKSAGYVLIGLIDLGPGFTATRVVTTQNKLIAEQIWIARGKTTYGFSNKSLAAAIKAAK